MTCAAFILALFLGALGGDADGKPATDDPGEWIVEFVYDALGRLISTRRDWGDQSGDIRQVEFYYDGVRRIAEVITDPIEGFGGSRPIEFTYATPDGNGNQTWTDREYVWSPFYVDDLVVQVDAEENPLYALQDANENLVGLVNEYGEVQSQYTLDPYGTIRVAEKLEAHAVNRVAHQGLFAIRLSGAPTDEQFEAGEPTLYYNRNRILDPAKGRPLQRDPNATALAVISELAFNGVALYPSAGRLNLEGHYGDGLNTLAYVASNPLARRDPSGLEFNFVSIMSNILTRPIVGNVAVTGGKIALNLVDDVIMGYSGTSMGFGLMGSGTFVATRYGDEIIGGVSRFGDEVAEGVSRIWTGRGYERYVQRVLDADDGFSVGGRQFDGSWKSLFGEVWLEMKTFIKPDKIAQAKSQIGQQYRIATDNGVGYMVVSPSPLPAEVVDYLSKMGIDHMIIP